MFLSGTPQEAEEEVAPQTPLDMILADKVLQFRCKRLLDAGLALAHARDLALDRTVDIHFVEGLVAKGCTPALAYEIAA